MNRLMRWLAACGICWGCCLAEWAADGAEIGHVEAHGFGGWAYGRTENHNRYLLGNKDGNYDNVNFSLNLSATPHEHLGVYAQTGFNETFGKNETGLDYAFAEWFVRDEFRIRAGKVKAPFMLYSEVHDVGTIRPFFNLPPSIYQQFAPEAYKGIGMTGTRFFNNGWGCSYDGYFGEMKLFPQTGIFLDPQLTIFTFSPTMRDLVGGRFMIQPPITGLSFGTSFYAGSGYMSTDESNPSKSVFDDQYLFWGNSVEYVSDAWWLRSEYLSQHKSDALTLDAVYLESAYRFTEHWQLAASVEWFDGESVLLNGTILESFLEHQSAAIGVNYWMGPGCVVKAAYHVVKGNRNAFPDQQEDLSEVLEKGGFDEHAELFSIGAQFSF